MSNWRAVLIAITASVLTACSGSPQPSPSSERSTQVEEVFTASGVLTLTLPLMSDSTAGNLQLCGRQMPVETGHQVTIENVQNEVVGYGTLSPITFEPADGSCRTTWTAENLPASTGVYALRIADGFEPIHFRQQEGERGLVSRFPDPEVP